MSDCVVVLITTHSAKVAEQIADELQRQHLVACTNIVPSVRSVFQWEGSVARQEEVLMIVKTTTDAIDCGLVGVVKQLHSYDLPEIVALPVVAGSAEYLDWIRSSVE